MHSIYSCHHGNDAPGASQALEHPGTKASSHAQDGSLFDWLFMVSSAELLFVHPAIPRDLKAYLFPKSPCHQHAHLMIFLVTMSCFGPSPWTKGNICLWPSLPSSQVSRRRCYLTFCSLTECPFISALQGCPLLQCPLLIPRRTSATAFHFHFHWCQHSMKNHV